jgi:hypothetical protein
MCGVRGPKGEAPPQADGSHCENQQLTAVGARAQRQTVPNTGTLDDVCRVQTGPTSKGGLMPGRETDAAWHALELTLTGYLPVPSALANMDHPQF